jgi:hypothetical protein
MTTTALKQTVDALNESERTYLAAYLKVQSLIGSEAHRAELGQRMRDMDQGRSLSADSVKELHRALESKGL